MPKASSTKLPWRPSKLDDAVVAKAKLYLEAWPDLKQAVPTVEGLALYIGIRRETIYEWSGEYTPPQQPDNLTPAQQKQYDKYVKKQRQRYEAFSNIVNELKATQALELINNGLKGRFNARIVTLILSGKHGYVEKSQQDLTTNGKELPTPIIKLNNQEQGDA